MKQRTQNDRGIALIVVLLVMMIFTVMMLGFYFVTTGEQKIAASDRDNTVAYYGAVGGLEKMSSDLAKSFVTSSSPTPAEIDALAGPANAPNSPGVTFPTGGYIIAYTTVGGVLASSVQSIGGSGPLQGLQGIITPFTLTVIANGPNNTEVKMTRVVQEVSVPVFQFGIYSENDLSFFAGPDFSFGGRVHTNGNLFLAEGGGTLTLGDRVTAFQDVIRQQLSNGLSTSSGYNGTVNLITTPAACPGAAPGCRPLAVTEGSVTGGPGSLANPGWTSLSVTTYNGNIRNGKTGAKKLNLALALAGAPPIAMIQRPLTTPVEAPTSTVGSERFFNQASLRILLSDTAAPIMGLPAVDATVTPFPLDETLIHIAPYNIPLADKCHPPLAESKGSADYMSPAASKLLGGFIKIEIQLNATPGTWKDVTAEILKLGISRDVQSSGPSPCATNNSILHLEEVFPGFSLNSLARTILPTNFIPVNIYDPREGEVRDNTGPTTVTLNGVINTTELDVHNLQKWFAGSIGASGTTALNRSGFIVYFSDRRGNNNGGVETGEYGNEDIINPASGTGAPNGILDAPEDLDGDGVFRTYGATPRPLVPPPAGFWTTFMATATPLGPRVTAAQGQENSVIFFRRALRLINGTLGNLPPLASANCTSTTAGGFTVAAENPIYIQGDYNASVANGFGDTAVPPTAGLCHVPAAVIGDAVTVISNNWTDDAVSFANPTNPSGRPASDTYYRTAIIGGKNRSFPLPGFTPSPPSDYGTDGGTHNFVRYIEDWSGPGATYYYRGSLVSFYVSRQGTGVYKCCNTVYGAPARGENFDTDFQSIAKLPPGTPHFTDVNALSFQQAILSSE